MHKMEYDLTAMPLTEFLHRRDVKKGEASYAGTLTVRMTYDGRNLVVEMLFKDKPINRLDIAC